MIGPKSLRAIREELRRALTATGKDPIRALEQRLSACDSPGIASVGDGEVMQSLKRFLQEPTTSGKRRRSVVKKTGIPLA